MVTDVTDVILAFGANLPNGQMPPRKTIQRALADLAAKGVDALRISPWYETKPVPATGQPNFLNMVAVGTTRLAPDELMARCSEIELVYGRERGADAVRWDARTLDIDILAYGDVVLPSMHLWHNEAAIRGSASAPASLTIPHPRLHQRAFVLVPLADVAATWDHPVLGLSSQELLQLHAEHHPDDVKNVQKLDD